MEIDFNTENNLDLGFTSSVSMDESLAIGETPSGIDEVKVDGTPLPIVNKSVNIDLATPLSTKANINQLPTKTSALINDGSDGTSTYVEADELGAVATSNNYNDLDNKPTIPTPITVDSEINNTSTNPVQNKALYDAIVGKEIVFSVPATAWSEPSGTNPYNTVAIVTLPDGSFTNNCAIELMIADKFNDFAKYGFVIYSAEAASQRIWLTALKKPTSNTYLTIKVYTYGN